MIKVNGVVIPTPSSLSFGIMDISQAERVASGKIVIDRIATKVKIELSWNYLVDSQLSTLLSAVSSVSFNVEYLDPRSNSLMTKEFYVGDRKMGMYSYVSNTPVWTGIAFNFIEV